MVMKKKKTTPTGSCLYHMYLSSYGAFYLDFGFTCSGDLCTSILVLGQSLVPDTHLTGENGAIQINHILMNDHA